MTDRTPSTTATNASEHADRYEALRDHALDPHRGLIARDGLAVLLRQGVSAWMDAWSRLPAAPPEPTRAERKQPSPLPDNASAEVVRVLAAMTLGHIQEVRA